MEKIIEIDSKKITLKACAKNLLVYNAQFGEDFFSAAGGLVNVGINGNIDFRKIHSIQLAQLVWSLAKTADDSTPPFPEWFLQFDAFPVLDIYSEIIELLTVNMTVKNAAAVTADE